jgi:phosphodiesterase/alkaline phosphatase D-like protein
LQSLEKKFDPSFESGWFQEFFFTLIKDANIHDARLKTTIVWNTWKVIQEDQENYKLVKKYIPLFFEGNFQDEPVAQFEFLINEVKKISSEDAKDLFKKEMKYLLRGLTASPHGFFTNYWFEYGTTENLGNKTSVQNIGSGYSALMSPAYITGLIKNTKYFFRIVAQNQYGKVSGNSYSFTTNTGSPAPVGSLPTVKTASASGLSRTGATIYGEVTPNQSVINYWFEYGKSSDLGNISSIQTISDSNMKTQVSLQLSTLTPLTTYYFRVNAQNQWGTVTGDTVTFKTSGPADTSTPLAETNSVSNLKTTTVTLRGTVNPNGIETNYWFEYSTDSLLGSALLKTTAHKSTGAGTKDVTLESQVSGLTTGTTYFYRIVAQNSLGIAYGDRTAFTTK